PTPERREAGPGDHGEVDGARIVDDPVLERPRGLVDHDQDAALADDVVRDGAAFGGHGVAELGVDRLVDALFALALVAVEAAAALLTEARGLAQLEQRRRRPHPV